MKLETRRTFGPQLAPSITREPRPRGIDDGRLLVGLDLGHHSLQVGLMARLFDDGLLEVFAEQWDRGIPALSTMHQLVRPWTTAILPVGLEPAAWNTPAGHAATIAEILEGAGFDPKPIRVGPTARLGMIRVSALDVNPRIRLRLTPEVPRLAKAISDHTHKVNRNGAMIQRPTGPTHAIDALGYVLALAHALAHPAAAAVL